MKGTMVKCLQCNTVSVYMAAHDNVSRCPICKGYAIPQGECNIVEGQMDTETITLYADGKEWLKEENTVEWNVTGLFRAIHGQ